MIVPINEFWGTVAKSAAKGAGIGGALYAGRQFINDEPITARGIAKGAMVGGALGGTVIGVPKAIVKGIKDTVKEKTSSLANKFANSKAMRDKTAQSIKKVRSAARNGEVLTDAFCYYPVSNEIMRYIG